MMRRALITASLIAVLASTQFAFAAGAEESDGPHRHHKAVVELIGAHGGGFLGVQLTQITPELRTHFGVPDDVGVMVSRVVADSPAEKAGLRVGDIVTRAGDEDVGSAAALSGAVRRRGGEAVDFEVWRDGQVQTVTALLEDREGPGRAFERAFAHACEDGDCRRGLVHRLQKKIHAFGCGDLEDCDLTVRCEDGDCECTLNGEAADCDELRIHSLVKPHEHRD